jgi:hypothetical protein
VIPITWTDKARIPNLPELVDRVRTHGGSIVEFQRVWSLLLYCQWGPIYRWVGPRQSRYVSGLGHAAFCFLFGWWSPAGIIWTLPAVVNNLCGGVDVTSIYTKPPPLPGQMLDADESAAYAEYTASRSRQGLLTFLSGALVVGFLLYLGWREVSGPKPAGNSTPAVRSKTADRLVSLLFTRSVGAMAPDTKILKPDGSYVLIGDLHTGDNVMGYDPETKREKSIAAVAGQVMDTPKRLYELALDLDGDKVPDELLYMSEAHYFLKKSGVWTNAPSIEVGDELAGGSGAAFTVVATTLKRFTEKTEELPWKRTGDDGSRNSFGISVADSPAFFVTRVGKAPVLVATSADLFRYSEEQMKNSTK